MELFPGVHEISSHFGNRWVKQYLLIGEQMTVLLDTGVATTPEKVIFPYLERIGVPPNRISMAIALHADADHHGGIPAIKNASPNTLLACGKQDLELIESPELLYSLRYNFLAERHGLGFNRDGMVFCPEGRRMDVVLGAGESLYISKDWPLRVWHVPGHSAGHLAVYDEKHRAAFTSDAVQTNGYPTVDGGMAFGPTYYTVDAYLATVHYLENKPIDHMFSGHWPAVHGVDVKTFLTSTREFVARADELVLNYLREHTNGATLKQLLHALSPKLGSWPDDTAMFLQFAMYGHVRRLEERGIVRGGADAPVTYRLV